MAQPIRASERGVVVDVLVQPNASRSEVIGQHGDRVKVRVTAPPHRLEANAAVVDLLSSVTGARKAEVVAGRTTRFKTVELVGIDEDTAKRTLCGA